MATLHEYKLPDVRQVFRTLLPLLLFGSCVDKGTEPEPILDYNWTVTVLPLQNNSSEFMYDIWGTGSTNIYACGGRAQSGALGGLFRFDGKTWNPVDSGVAQFHEFRDILGFGANDMWIAASGDNLYSTPALLHFDGAEWTQVLPNGLGMESLTTLWGSSSDDIYAGSQDGKIVHAQNGQWIVDTLYQGRFFVQSIFTLAGIVHAIGTTDDAPAPDTVIWYTKNAGTWTVSGSQLVEDYLSEPQFGWTKLSDPLNNVYYAGSSDGVFKLQEGAWQRSFNAQAKITSVQGTSPSNVFAVGYRKNVFGRPTEAYLAHWNGVSWKEIAEATKTLPNGVGLTGVIAFNNEVFVSGHDQTHSYVLHGR